MIIINFLSGLLFFLCYYPPTFKMKFHGRSIGQQLRDFDFVGTVLFVGGFLTFLLGLSWGGSVYPWKSAHVIATMVIGGVILIVFALWESYANLKEPLLPLHLFKNIRWVAACILLGLGARQVHPIFNSSEANRNSIYYAMAIIWPQMVDILYTDDGGASMYAGLLACAPSAMINGGQIVAGFLAEPIGKTKLQCMSVLAIGGTFLGGKSCLLLIISC
jgi:Fungal trichothecene efflux pump (TRI12)